MAKKKCKCDDIRQRTEAWGLVAITFKCPQHGSITIDRRNSWGGYTYYYYPYVNPQTTFTIPSISPTTTTWTSQASS